MPDQGLNNRPVDLARKIPDRGQKDVPVDLIVKILWRPVLCARRDAREKGQKIPQRDICIFRQHFTVKYSLLLTALGVCPWSLHW